MTPPVGVSFYFVHPMRHREAHGQDSHDAEMEAIVWSGKDGGYAWTLQRAFLNNADLATTTAEC